ncbi:hypothetical protein [Hwanghaeella sp. LZ110]|uniref:hypothetical protein n=1 Tax=Hwanghaeella sp. LZ110 TaxID=3402810 RepID=UPI003B67B31A
MKVEYYQNCYYRVYDEMETKQLFMPVFDKIFVSPDHLNSLTSSPIRGSALFRDPTWKIIGFGSAAWGGISSYIRPSAPKKCVQHDRETDKWDLLRPLYVTLVEREVDEVIHMNRLKTSDHEHRAENGAISSLPLANTTTRANLEPLNILTSGCMFSRDGDWGLFGDDDTVTILGGEPQLMARVIELAGGEDFLRTDFDQCWIDHYVMSAPVDHDWTFACYECIGWPVPDIIRNLEPGQSLDRSHLSWINDVADKGRE